MKAQRGGLALAGAAAILAFQVGCGSGGLPATHYYTLGAPPEAANRPAPAGRDAGAAIGVDSFVVDPPYDQDRIVYRSSPAATEIGFYNYHRWASPLGRLIQQAMVDGVRGARGVGVVEPAGSSGDYDARLGGRVLYLEQIDGGSGRTVRVALELVLRNGSDVLWSETLEASVGGEITDGSDAARLLGQAFAEIVDAARAGLESRLPG